MQRMTGHVQLVNHVVFSPNGHFVASASFDRSVRSHPINPMRVRVRVRVSASFDRSVRSHPIGVRIRSLVEPNCCCGPAWRPWVGPYPHPNSNPAWRLWDGATGKFITALRGHVQACYQVCWSADSRLLLSGSKDSTLKLWDVAAKKQKLELPGHADEVFAVDWSPDGQKVLTLTLSP